MPGKRVAVVGSGCAGLGAFWALATSTEHDVHLFEADEVLGGHTNTVAWQHDGKEVNVDTGFIVYNTATYPNFIQFLKTVGVNSVPTDMTFGVSRDKGSFEWSGTSLGSVFAQKSNLFSPRMWRMLFDVVRFNQYALDLLHKEDESEDDPTTENGLTHHPKAASQPAQESIGEYLEREGYSDAFKNDYLIPMTAAVWSTAPDKCSLEFPAITLVRFMWNHHLLSTVAARPQWMTIPGGSQKYIEAVLKIAPEGSVHLNSPVTGIEDINGKIILQFEEDEQLFDHVIMACHGDQVFEIIKDGATEEERLVLGSFQTTENQAYLHSDLSMMPRNRKAWSAWNLLTESSDFSKSSDPSSTAKVSLTYNMNILQHIPTSEYSDVLVTLNPPSLPDRDSIQGSWTYHHPVYNAAAVEAQKLLPRIQNTRSVSYAGAWTKYGFHEDGFSSGIQVACEHLGAELPWEFVDSTFSRGRRPRLGVLDYAARAAIWYVGCGFWWLDTVLWPFDQVAKVFEKEKLA